MELFQIQQNEFLISTDGQKLDIPLIHAFLSRDSYWAQGIPLEAVERSLNHSLCFGLYRREQQIGFARVITDYTTFAYVGDVFVVPAWRRKGLSKWLVQAMREHPGLQGLRRWLLVTADAHGLYEQFGFTSITQPEKFMQIHDPDAYKQHP